MNTTAEKKAKLKEKYGRSQEETLRCSEYAKRWWPKETSHRMRIADEVRNQLFLFDLPWDMEQTAEPVTFEGEIDWSYQPGPDPEFIFQMNRHQYWICLGQAYAMTGDEAYAECFASQLVHWIKKNPLTEETKGTTWRTIEAGIRGINWLRAMGYFVDSPAVTDEVFEQFLSCMREHGVYLAACERPFSTKSNWGVLENNGLFAIAHLLQETGDCPEAGAWIKLAKNRLIRQNWVQILDDGVQWEMSPMYHNEVLKCFLEALQTAAFYDDEFPQEFQDKVKSMVFADRIWQKPDKSQPSGGDSDVTDLRDLLTAGAFWFEDPVLKSGGYDRMDYEGIWNYGICAQVRYEALASCEPESLDCWLSDSGNWYLRSSWQEDADYLHMRCGSLGGGHGHFDKGHLDLVIGGEDVLVDPGRYTYVDGTERRMLKSTKAHNTVTVDSEEYTHCVDSWGVKGLWPAVGGAMSRKGKYGFAECGHLGYIDRGVYVERRVLAVGTRIYVVMDTCYGNGDHTLTQHFHPALNQKVTVRENGFILEGEKSRAEFFCISGHEGSIVLEEEAFPVSLHYNQIENGTMVSCKKQGNGVFGMMTVIVCSALNENERGAWAEAVPVMSAMAGKPLSSHEADGVRIQAQGHTWLVVNAHVEAGASCEYIGAEGRFGLGRVMAAEDDEEDMTVLKW